MAAELCVFTEPQQGASYDSLLAVARRAEALGMTGFFRSDHYLRMGSASGLPGPTDAWVTLAGLARDTTAIRLGTLVTCATFRHPAELAIGVAEVDAMSGGRVDFGIGAGWYSAEHEAYGIPFPATGERFSRLEEQLQIITGLWQQQKGEPFHFEGRYYRLSGTPAPPRPVQDPLPIIIGGKGPKRTPALAARFAHEYNVSFAPIEKFREQCELVAAACEAGGRDPASLRYSAGMVLCCGRDEAEFRRRAAAIGRDPDDLRRNGACGVVDEVMDTLARWQEAGATRLYLQMLDLGDLDHLDLVVESYRSHVGS
jgi:F420-dependent oxidoreductase-like protein